MDEKDFIPDERGKHPFRSWFLWGVFFFLLLWVLHLVLEKFTDSKKSEERTYLEVTNREFSLFLWQFPEHMRVNAKRKAGYLTGFQYDPKITLELSMADEHVVAPPELLFLYHTWHRLIGSPADIPDKISRSEFIEFLNYAEEWKPENWLQAPPQYIAFFDTLVLQPEELEGRVLPKIVLQAFQGWRNFFKDGQAIESLFITPDLLAQFLEHAPHYKRPYWRNLQPSYLNPDIPAFLRVAIFNWQSN